MRGAFQTVLEHADRSEIKRMHMMQRESRSTKWLPLWSQSDAKVRLVIYTYTFNYVKHTIGGTPAPGTPLSTLEQIARTDCRARIEKRLSHVGDKERATIQKHLDTSENGIASRAARLIHMAYRQRLKAPDIAQELGMTNVNVRMLLCRLNRLARKLFPESECAPRHPNAKPETDLISKQRQRVKHHKQRSKIPDALRQHLAPREKRIVEPAKPSQAILDMAKLYNEGMCCKELSALSGIPPSTLAWSLVRFDLISPNRPKHMRQAVTPEMAELFYWHTHGATTAELSRLSGLHDATLRSRFKRMEAANGTALTRS